MLTVIQTPIFQRMVGDVIPGVGDLRKVRWTRQGMGKRGGACRNLCQSQI